MAIHFSRDLDAVLAQAEVIVLCTGHKLYRDRCDAMLDAATQAIGVFDACNLWSAPAVQAHGLRYGGIGRGHAAAPEALVEAVLDGFRAVETGVGNEVAALVTFLNSRYAADSFNAVRFADVQRIAATCVTGCEIASPGPVPSAVGAAGFASRLAAHAAAASMSEAADATQQA